jgi:hypothetical protein
LGRTQALYSQAQAAQQAEQKIQAQRFEQYGRAEDSRFEQAIKNESIETRRAVTENGARILQQHYGVDVRAFAEAVSTNPALRAAETQKMMFDLIKTKLAQEAIPSKLDRLAPPVPQRPGVSQPPSSSDEVDSALRAFRDDPSPKSAARLLIARRVGLSATR